tara:strand:- start:1178 stop:2707 length:1530 start_codon:yes stop_codon:yes gene_type:complete
VIGINNELVFHIKEDMDYFKEITTGHIVVMGYNTWKSLKKPLKDRYNVVISKNHYDEILGNDLESEMEQEDLVKPDKVFQSYEEMIDYFFTTRHYGSETFKEEVTMCGDHNYLVESPDIFIIGGSRLYEEAFSNGVNSIYETRCMEDVLDPIDNLYKYTDKGDGTDIAKCEIDVRDNDKYLLTYCKQSNGEGKLYRKVRLSDGNIFTERMKMNIRYGFLIYRSKSEVNMEELSYLRLLNKVYGNGGKRKSRNSEVLSLFGEKMKFDLRKGFPLLTSKKVGWKTILRELIWFLNGSTNNKLLQEKNVHIWDGNSSKEYMESRGLDYEEGELGPIYGFQWRNFGGEYGVKGGKEGVDQVKYMIDLINNDPTSRRILLSAWNPPDLDKMALPPCHIMFQIYVDGDFIDGQMYQRSGDMFLGVPFNIASYSFLLHIIGKITKKTPRYFHHILGDCHIYSNHYEAIEKQLKNNTYPFPTIEISDELNNIDTIDESYINIKNYRSNSSIKAEMIA